MDLLRKWWNGAGSARAPGDLPIYSDTQHHSSSCGRLSCFEKEVPSTEGYVDQLEFISKHSVQDNVMVLFVPIIFVLTVFPLAP